MSLSPIYLASIYKKFKPFKMKYKTEKIHIKNFTGWFIEYNGTQYARSNDPEDITLEILKIPFSEYLDIKHQYPMIYIGGPDHLITEYSELTDRYNFMPTIEYAAEEECYLKFDPDEIVNVIVNCHV